VVAGPGAVDSNLLYAFNGQSRRLVAILNSANGHTFCGAGHSDFRCPTDPNAFAVNYGCVEPGTILSNDLCVEAGLPGGGCVDDASTRCVAPYTCVLPDSGCCASAVYGCGRCLPPGFPVDASAGVLDNCTDGGSLDAGGE
jgi:hypothetical protein